MQKAGTACALVVDVQLASIQKSDDRPSDATSFSVHAVSQQ
jgi:hypothetical protein